MGLAFISFGLCYTDSLTGITLQRYVLMLLLACETVCRTCMATVIYMIAAGWGTLRFFFDSEEATKTAKILGCSYLTHSAFFVTMDIPPLHAAMRNTLIAFYVCIALFMACENRNSIRIIERNEAFARD